MTPFAERDPERSPDPQPAEPPPTSEELEVEGPNESAPGHNPPPGDEDDGPAAA